MQIEAYCADGSSEAALNLGGSMLFIRAAFEVFKKIVLAGGFRPGGVGGVAGGGAGGGAAAGGKGGDAGGAAAALLFCPGGASAVKEGAERSAAFLSRAVRAVRALLGGRSRAGQDAAEQIRKLKLQVAQRDNEINILVGMIKRRDGGNAAGERWQLQAAFLGGRYVVGFAGGGAKGA